jgi:hypothetical protein
MTRASNKKLVDNNNNNNININKDVANVPDVACYCVLESDDGARIVTTVAAKEYMSPQRNGQYTVHFAGDLDNAKALQVDIESKKKKNQVEEQKTSSKLVVPEINSGKSSACKNIEYTKVYFIIMTSEHQSCCIETELSPVTKKGRHENTDDDKVNDTNETVLQTKDTLVDNIEKEAPKEPSIVDLYKSDKNATTPVKGVHISQLFNSANKNSPSKAEFVSMFKQMSSEKSSTLSKAGIFISVSKTYESGKSYKAVIMVQMVDEKGYVYWCFKANVFGMIYATVARLINLDQPEFEHFFEAFKRSKESGSEIELWATDKKKLSTLNPQVNGNKVLVIPIEADSDPSLTAKVNSICEKIDIINNHDMMSKDWMEAALASDILNYNVSFQSKTMGDSTFWKLMQTKAIIENNVPLDRIITHSAIGKMINSFFLGGNGKNPSMWDNDLKSVAFTNGSVPNDFDF